MTLVILHTFFTDPSKRILGLTCSVVLIAVLQIFVKPYKSEVANKMASLSYLATLAIAMISQGKTFASFFQCKHYCDNFHSLASAAGTLEHILFYGPVAAALIGLVILIVKKVKKAK